MEMNGIEEDEQREILGRFGANEVDYIGFRLGIEARSHVLDLNRIHIFSDKC